MSLEKTIKAIHPFLCDRQIVGPNNRAGLTKEMQTEHGVMRITKNGSWPLDQ